MHSSNLLSVILRINIRYKIRHYSYGNKTRFSSDHKLCKNDYLNIKFYLAKHSCSEICSSEKLLFSN